MPLFEPQAAYDSIAYPDHAQRDAHVRQLEAVAVLMGMNPPAVTDCRVLEIGCATGANLLPQAYDLPESRFVGIDLSPAQIQTANSLAQKLELGNIDFRAADLCDIDASWGLFDYIIAHGVYSWTPPAVRDALMKVCKQNLAPQGVAYVSYNVLPGWHTRQAVRHALVYHVQAIDDARKQVEQARSLIEFLSEHGSESAQWKQQLQGERDFMRGLADGGVFHEHLERDNTPVYFHEFVEHAGRHGLGYIADADLSVNNPQQIPAKAMATLGNLPRERVEQYVDFLMGRSFRRTLLCHAEATRDERIDTDRLRGLFVAAAGAVTTTDFGIDRSAPVEIAIAPHAIRVADPLIKAVFAQLASIYPAAITLEELHEKAVGRLPVAMRGGQQGTSAVESVGPVILSAALHGMLMLSRHAPQCCVQIAHRPIASAVARIQAQDVSDVTNRRHCLTRLDATARFVIGLLDGRHDVHMIVDKVERAVRKGTLSIQASDGRPAGTGAILTVFERMLEGFAQSALLVG
ncbi:MAG: class I SAM-dependent methyltransferase [Phycisphaeraceae bacterium]